MKYIKTYENLDQKDLKNLMRRLEYNLRKYFGDFNDQFYDAYANKLDNNIHDAKECVSVWGFNDNITISILYWDKQSPKFEAYINELNRLGIKNWKGHASNISSIQAELLLAELKNKNLYNNVLDIEIKKYNL